MGENKKMNLNKVLDVCFNVLTGIFNQKNLDSFNKATSDFGKSMDKMTKELGSDIDKSKSQI
ncbi:MAG: hypothetical protein HRU07_07250 [Nitrosopumilus sp.]|nr:hypothetical protein [Nitrosopumilus sp.]NRA05934.1 hypothetical protein [Nitrosopumilus sp.]